MKRIALIGGGGFAKEVYELAKLNGHDVVGYVGEGQGVLKSPYWGRMEALTDKRADFDCVCIAFGSVDRKSSEGRAKMVGWLNEQGFLSIPLVSPYAVRSAGVEIADGAIVAHGVTMSVDCTVGAFAILNSNSIIGHDAAIGCNVTIAPGAFIGGTAEIQRDSLIGPGAIVLEGRMVGKGVVVGLGATVIRNVKDGSTVMPLRSKVLATKVG
jgi:acetyltransferase EpsM